MSSPHEETFDLFVSYAHLDDRNGTVTLSRSSLAASGSATFDLVVHVGSGVTSSLTNTATGTTTTNDSNSNNDSFTNYPTTILLVIL